MMSKMKLLIAAVAVLWIAVPEATAQSPAWPPSPDHLTMPIWPGTAPGVVAAGAQSIAETDADVTTPKDGSPA